ncbi:hypothetical protein FRB98_005150, partial [Tulasnella sp. 332]
MLRKVATLGQLRRTSSEEISKLPSSKSSPNDVSGALNVKPSTPAMDTIRIIHTSSSNSSVLSSSSTSSTQRRSSSAFETDPDRIYAPDMITYPARRPLSAVEEEECEVQSLMSFRRSSSTTLGASNFSTPDLSDANPDSAFSESVASTSSDEGRRQEKGGNALGLVLAMEEDEDDDERGPRMQSGFPTLPIGRDSSIIKQDNLPTKPPKNPLRRQNRQIHSITVSSHPAPPESYSTSALQSPPTLLSEKDMLLDCDLPTTTRTRTQTVQTIPDAIATLPPRPRFQRGDPLPPLFVHGHLAKPDLLALLQSSAKGKFLIQPARIKKGSYETRIISKHDWPVLIPSYSYSPTSSNIDGVLLHNLTSADRRRFKLLHPQYQPPTVRDKGKSGGRASFVPLFTRTLVRVCTRDGSVLDATAFVWRDDATEATGLRLVTAEEER